MSGSLQKSTEVMKSMNTLMRVPEVRETMMELSKEMTKVRVFGFALMKDEGHLVVLGWYHGGNARGHI